MKIVFMGTPSYATEILKALLKAPDMEVVLLVTQPDKPVGRKQILTPPDTKKYLLETGSQIDIYQPQTLRDEKVVTKIVSYAPDFIVVAAYGQILPESVLAIAPCINLHASLLPKYRGASPIQAAILAGDRYSGVTAMRMDKGLDTGDMLGFSVVDIREMDASRLFAKLSEEAAKLCVETLRRFDMIEPLPQNGCDSSYAPKITKADGLVDFDDAVKLDAKYRAFIFWPGVYLQSGLKLKSLRLVVKEGNYPEGEILEIADDHIIVGCRRGKVAIDMVQPPSKKEMSVIDYIHGKRLDVGDTLS